MRLHVPTTLRWSDLDAYGHVNNVQVLRLLEEARVRSFSSVNGDPEPAAVAINGGSEPLPPISVLERGPQASTLTFIARQTIEYLEPIPYVRQPLDVQLWISALGGASLDLDYEIHSPVGTPDVVYARAIATIVLVDAKTERPRRMTDAEREAWLPLFEEPVAMRR